MLELGKFSKKLHVDVAKFINKTKINKVYVYGKYVKDTFRNLVKNKKGEIFKNKNEIYHFVRKNIDNNHHFMFKGSNSTGLQEVVSNIKKRKIYAL
jgi:UDP-N-acetylmuramyl pentapeptide synthase